MKKVFSTILATAIAASMSAAVTPHFDLEVGYDHANRVLHTDISGEENGVIRNSDLNGFHLGGNILMNFAEEGANSLPGLSIGLNYQFLGANGYMSEDSYKHDKQNFHKKIYQEGITDVVYKDFTQVHSLQLPIRFQYTYQFDNDFRVFAYTGPQLRIHIVEKLTHEESYSVKHYTSKDDFEYLKNGWVTTNNFISGKNKYTVWDDGEKEDVEVEDTKKDDREPMFDIAWGFGLGFGWKFISLNVSYDLGMMNMQSKNKRKDYAAMGSKHIINDNVLAVTLGFRLK